MQQLEAVHNHAVRGAQVSEFARLLGAPADLRGRYVLEGAADKRKQVAAFGILRDTESEFLAAAGTGNQPHADFHQADIAFQRRHRAVAVHDDFAAPAQRHAVHRGNGWHHRIAQRHVGDLELLDYLLDFLQATGHQRIRHVQFARNAENRGFRAAPELLYHRGKRGWLACGPAPAALQIGANRERRLGLPDHQPLETALGFIDRLHDPVEHVFTDRVHLALEAEHRDVVAGGPQPHAIGFEHRAAVRGRLGNQAVRERLAPIDRQRGTRRIAVVRGTIGALCRMHAGAVRLAHPVRQRRVRHGLARHNVRFNPACDLRPAGGLPALERSLVPAEAPADREIHVARVVGDRLQMKRAVMQHVAECRPHELRLRVAAGAQLREPLDRVAVLQDLDHRRVGFAARCAVGLRCDVQNLDLLADLLVHAALALLPERIFFE